MIQHNTQEKKGILRAFMLKPGGQVSLVMVFVLIIALVFFAFSLNWKAAASSKWKTINAATVGAAQIASNYLSYTYMIAETQLEGLVYKKKCGWNFGYIFAIILTFVAIMCPPLALISVACAVTAGIGGYAMDKQTSQVVKDWNKMHISTGSMAGDFVEGGAMTAFQLVEGDQESVYDLSDANQDGKYCSSDMDLSKCKERVARVISYTSRQIKRYIRPVISGSEEYRAALEALKEELGFALYKKTGCAACQESPQKCNPCCVSGENRPASCSAAETQECLSSQADSYDPLFCARQDPSFFVSFWGLPDSDRSTKKIRANDPSSPLVVDPVLIARGADTEGNIFPLMSLIKDSTVPVSALDANAVANNSKACLWCAKERVVGDGVCAQSPRNELFWGSFQQLDLENCEGAACCAGVFSNAVSGTATDSRVMDRVNTAPDLTTANVSWWIDTGDGDDPDDSDDPDDAEEWDDAEYEDDEVEGVDFVVSGAKSTAVASADSTSEEFYGSAALMLIEEAVKIETLLNSLGSVLDNKAQLRVYTQELVGRMNILTDSMNRVKEKLDTWLSRTGFNQMNTWCVPASDAEIPSLKEKTAIRANGAVWGSFQSVVNCLNYNGNNQNAFDACRMSCSTQCVDLPRSLVPGFDTTSTAPDCSEGSAYLANIEKSAFLARNQSIKFQQRGLYLKRIFDGTVLIRDKFAEKVIAIREATQALEAAAAAVGTSVTGVTSGGEASHIYGWMGPAPTGKTRGSWHIIGVSARGINELAWVEMKKKKSHCLFGVCTRICYRWWLRAFSGSVRVSAWRYDEDLQTMDKFFKKVLSPGDDLGNAIYDACVEEADKKLWCPGGVSSEAATRGECLGGEDRHWRPAFIGRNGVCAAVVDKARDQSVSYSKGLSYGNGNTEPDYLKDPRYIPTLSFH